MTGLTHTFILLLNELTLLDESYSGETFIIPRLYHDLTILYLIPPRPQATALGLVTSRL